MCCEMAVSSPHVFRQRRREHFRLRDFRFGGSRPSVELLVDGVELLGEDGGNGSRSEARRTPAQGAGFIL